MNAHTNSARGVATPAGASGFSRFVLAVACAALAIAGAGAHRAVAQGTMRFEPIGVFDLEIDGKVAPKARIFHSPQAQAVLVITPELPYPIAAVPRNKTIQRLDPAQMKEEAVGSIAWTPAGPQTAVATFDLVEDKPVFELEGRKVRFLDKPPLLGPRTREEIWEYDPSYPYKMASANPPTAYLDAINAWPDPVRIKMFFSTQCQVCRDLLPGIFKFMDMVKNPKITWEFYGMPLPASKDPLSVELQIVDFPTAIFYDTAGKEIGRAWGHSWRLPDLAIHNALKGITVNPDALRVQPGAPKP